MAENNQPQVSEEIDLGYLFEKIKSFFKSVLIGIVGIVNFFWKHKFPLIGVGVIGIAVGLYFAKTTERNYISELLIKPNYNSTQYVYDKVKAINYKIDNNDTVYLEKVFGSNFKKARQIEIEPIIDVYELVSKSEEIEGTFTDLFKEIGDVSFFESEVNTLAYTNHRIILIISGQDFNENLSKTFFNYLVRNDFYQTNKIVFIDDVKQKLVENKIMRNQIDTIIKSVQEQSLTNQFSQGISFSGSQNVTELIKKKVELFENDLILATSLVTENEVISLIDINIGMLDHSYNFAYRIIPVYFILLYCLIFFVKFIVKKLSSLA